MVNRVLNKRTDKIPPGAVYIGRPSKWGNPMTIRELKRLFPDDTPLELQEKAVVWFREYITIPFGKPLGLMSQIGELKGRDLVCWCHTWDGKGENPMYCHGDVLLELANSQEGGGK